MRVLVTGGAGFIGSHIADLLLQGGHEVVVLDSLDSRAHRTVPSYLRDGVRFLRANVTDVDAWAAALEGVDAVSHQAAMVGLGVDFGDVRDYVAANDLGTAAGLWAMHRAAFRGRLVLASSMVVYGEGGYRCPADGRVRPAPRVEADLLAGQFEPRCPVCTAALEAEAVTEDAPLDPRNVYAATKVHQEHLVNAYAREHHSVAVSLRYHNVYGPRMPRDTPYAGVASIFRSSLERGAAPQVFEDGNQLRDFVHVSDVARANVAALTVPLDGSVAVNVASGVPHTVGQMASALAAAMRRGIAPELRPDRYRLGDVRHVFGSPAHAATVLGYRATTSFEDGMAEFAGAALRD